MILQFAGSSAEIFAKFREIEKRFAAFDRQPVAIVDHRGQPQNEALPCSSSDPLQGSPSYWRLAMPPES